MISKLLIIHIIIITLGIINLLLLQWSNEISIRLKCFIYASEFNIVIHYWLLLVGKLVNPISILFNICDKDLLY